MKTVGFVDFRSAKERYFRGAKVDKVSVISAFRTLHNKNNMKTIRSEVEGFHQPRVGV